MNAGNAVARNLVSVVRNQPLLEGEEEAARRLAICKECKFFVEARMICANCGCNLNIKTLLRAEHCPLENPKW